MATTLYWYDFETFGVDPRRDRIAQFAGIRTDLEFNVLDDPVVIYCKPPRDYLPHPEACLLTGITPQLAEKKGYPEYRFIDLILQQFTQPETCSLGYNSIRFDDEFTRNCLYRNFYDPYAREWQHGNSRWDLLDVMRAAYALRPQGIEWPNGDDGNVSFRLEALTSANCISHDNAHDALADVYATIALAKLLKTKQPRLFQFFWQNRSKHQARRLLAFGTNTPVIHISGRYSANKFCCAVVLPVCWHPGNSNGVIVYDLSVDPGDLLLLSAQEIQERVFTTSASLPDGVGRIPLKTIHLNKCPIIAPLSVLKEKDVQRLNLNLESCRKNAHRIVNTTGVADKISLVFSANVSAEAVPDPDLAIYSGGFFTDSDKKCFNQIKHATPGALAALQWQSSDKRIPELLFRYRARNFSETLNNEELERWQLHCATKLTKSEFGYLTFQQFFSLLDELDSRPDASSDIIQALFAFAEARMLELGLEKKERNDIVIKNNVV